MITKRGLIVMFNYLRYEILKATSEITSICTLKTLMNGCAPVDLEVADRWVSQTGEPLNEGFVDWMLKHPDDGQAYHLLAVFRYGNEIIFSVDIPTDTAEIYANMFRYEQERKTFTREDYVRIPWLYMTEDAWLNKTMHLMPPHDWDKFWDAYN